MAEAKSKPWTPTKQPVAVPIYCGSCVNFAGSAIRTNAEGQPATCSQLGIGITAKSKTCKDFSVDPFATSLRDAARDGMITRLIARIAPQALAPLATMLLTEIDTRKFGYHFGQKVYVNIMASSDNPAGNPRDYIANYYAGEIVKITPSGMAYVSHKTAKIAIGVGSLLTREQWAERRLFLLERDRIADPNNPHSWSRKDLKVLKDPLTKPPWLDAAIAKYVATRPTDDYTFVPTVKRGRGRPKGSTSTKSAKS